MRPRLIAAENPDDSVDDVELILASMRPRLIAAENRKINAIIFRAP